MEPVTLYYVLRIMGMWYCWCFFREILFEKTTFEKNHGDSRNFSQPQLWRRTEALGRTWNKRLDFGSGWHTPWYVALLCNKNSEGKSPKKHRGGWKRHHGKHKKTGWDERLCLWFVCFLGLVGVDGLRGSVTLGIFSSVTLWQVGDRKGNPSASNMTIFFWQWKLIEDTSS